MSYYDPNNDPAAQIDTLDSIVSSLEKERDAAIARAEASEAREARLREALTRIAQPDSVAADETWRQLALRLTGFARAALAAEGAPPERGEPWYFVVDRTSPRGHRGPSFDSLADAKRWLADTDGFVASECREVLAGPDREEGDRG